MAYIGKQPTIGNFQKCDAITVVNGQAAYTMQVGGTNVSPQSENHMLVSLNGIIQAPVDSFTISGSTITFASNLSTGDVIDFIMILGNVLDLGVPSDNTVSLAKLTATGTKSSSTFLRGDNTFQEVPAGLTEADNWRLNANLSGDHEPIASANFERADNTGYSKIGTGMSYDSSTGLFTFGATGLYYIVWTWSVQLDNSSDYSMTTYLQANISGTVTNLAQGKMSGDTSNNAHQVVTISAFYNVTNVSTHKLQININSMSNNDTRGNTGYNMTGISFIKLGDSQ